MHKQRPDEEIDQYIKYLYRHAEQCEWNCLGCGSNAFMEDMILLVTGLHGKKMSYSLQLEEYLSLTKAVSRFRQVEEVERQANSNVDYKEQLIEETNKTESEYNGPKWNKKT